MEQKSVGEQEWKEDRVPAGGRGKAAKNHKWWYRHPQGLRGGVSRNHRGVKEKETGQPEGAREMLQETTGDWGKVAGGPQRGGRVDHKSKQEG